MKQIEPRYVVLKCSDIDKMSIEDKILLQGIINKHMAIREERGVNPSLPCVVIEHDWPEFEPAVTAIIERINK